MGRSDDEPPAGDDLVAGRSADHCGDQHSDDYGRPAGAATLVELTRFVVARARERRRQLRALEADSGISKTTWSAWGRGQRVIGRDRLAEVARRYDPSQVREWLAAWDRLAVGALGAVDAAGAATGATAGPDGVLLVAESGAVVAGYLVVVVGSGRPDAGQRWLVSVRDWSSVAAVFRVGAVRYEQSAAAGDRWTARLALPGDSGNDYEVLVLAVDERFGAVEPALTSPAVDGWVMAHLPAAARVVAAVRVHGGDHRAGGHSANCLPT